MEQKPSLTILPSLYKEERVQVNPCSVPEIKDQLLKTAHCPVCKNSKAVSFYHGGHAPLTTLAWPKSQAEAQSMEKFPLDFCRCITCGHIYNQSFCYENVPYGDKPNLMYNRGFVWQRHLKETMELIASHMPKRPTILEIGTGDGHFLTGLSKLCPGGHYIGFDPNGSWSEANIEELGSKIEFHATWFEPSRHMAELKPDLIICRHLLEHLENPLDFIQTLASAALSASLSPALFVEVPCVENAIETGRTVDFFYEHPSQFSRPSLGRLLKQAGAVVEQLACGYNDEVVYSYARLGRHIVPAWKKDPVTLKKEAEAVIQDSLTFFERAQINDENLRQQLKLVAASQKTVALWGGTGKAATFINRYKAVADLFPLVVDSDEAKIDTYVPGTGQCIQSPEMLIQNPVEVIIITTPWRLEDILFEMKNKGIVCQDILVEVDGNLKRVNT